MLLPIHITEAGKTVLKCSFLFAFPHWEPRSILSSINCYLTAQTDQMLIRLALTSTAAQRVSLANDSVFMLTPPYWADPDWSIMLRGESECNAPPPPSGQYVCGPSLAPFSPFSSCPSCTYSPLPLCSWTLTCVPLSLCPSLLLYAPLWIIFETLF